MNRTKYLSPWTSFKVFKNDKFKLYVNIYWINLYHKTQKNLVLLSGLIIYMNAPLQSTSTDHGALTNKLESALGKYTHGIWYQCETIKFDRKKSQVKPIFFKQQTLCTCNEVNQFRHQWFMYLGHYKWEWVHSTNRPIHIELQCIIERTPHSWSN